MKEILTELFGDAVTDEAMKKFNAELGKKFVSKVDFNEKNEEVKSLKAEKQTLEDEVSKLNDTAKNGEDVKAELEKLKQQIADEKARSEKEKAEKEKADRVLERFNAAVGDKEFNHSAIRDSYLQRFGEALEAKEYEGQSDKDIFHSLTKDDGGAFKGVTVVKLTGGTARATSGKIPTIDEFKKMSYGQKLDLYNSNKELYDELKEQE